MKVILVPPKKGDIIVRCNLARDEPTCHTMDIEEKVTQTPGSVDSTEDSKLTLLSRLRIWMKPVAQKQNDVEKMETIDKTEEFESENDYTSPLDDFIGYAVDVTGSVYMLIFVILILVAWVLWGALTGASDVWQISMQDGQSIQTYIWDTFLMRQQLDDNENFLVLSGKLKSRLESHKRLVKKLQAEFPERAQMTPELEQRVRSLEKFKEKLITQAEKATLFDRISETCSNCLGNLYSVVIYWTGIFIWVGCGNLPNNNGSKEHPQMEKWSNNWQMYINTAVAIELLFTSVFLEHVRARSNKVIMMKVDIFNQMDIELERLERCTCQDYQENEIVIVKRCPRNSVQSMISFYAHVIGNGLGLIISTCVFIVWFAIGDLMNWSANWWLVIGTYTGLIGFIDGFVLREVFFSLTQHEHKEFYTLFEESQELVDMIKLPLTLKRYEPQINFDVKVSIWINNICSSQWSVITAVVVVLGLIIMASAMVWSETAQLICNTPTMIIEGFFLLILIQAHNWADDERSNMVSELTKSRLYIHNYVDACFCNMGEKNSEGDEDGDGDSDSDNSDGESDIDEVCGHGSHEIVL